jgi:uncharacterized protein (DUF433 family)
VQSDPRYVSGQPALRADPRMTVEQLVECADLGMAPDAIARTYDVPADTVLQLLDYARTHRRAAAAV